MPLWNVLVSSPVYLISATVFLCLFVFLLIIMWMNKRHQSARFFQESEHAQAIQELQHQAQLQNQLLNQTEQKLNEQQKNFEQHQEKYQQQLSLYQNKLYESERKLGEFHQQSIQLNDAKSQYQNLKQELQELQSKHSDLQARFQGMQESVAQERKGFDEKLSLLENAETKLNTQFENLANKIFEQKSEKFTKTSESGMNQILSPFKQQLDDFKRQITEQYTREGQERASLKTEILGLAQLNKQITEEAAALTNALKGDNKQQGNWGELVLERILSESGLRNGHEYEVQKNVTNEDGKRYQPDVVVHLPNNKDIIIDSKVSLIAHEKVVNAASKDERQRALKEHIASLKGHIKGLSLKDYQNLSGVTSLDYVLMFIPIESAFINAVEHEPELIKLALDNQIMLVSPTNLLVALRTINNIWQYEYQNQNAKVIADKASKMYDKLAGFVSDMEKIGKNMDTLRNSYEGAMNKLTSGKGNLIRQAEGFKALGLSTTKQIDSKYMQQDDDEGHEANEEATDKDGDSATSKTGDSE